MAELEPHCCGPRHNHSMCTVGSNVSLAGYKHKMNRKSFLFLISMVLGNENINDGPNKKAL